MSDLIKMLLSAEIDPASVKNIQTQIANISKSSASVKIKVDIDSESLKQMVNINKNISSQIGSTKMAKVDTSELEKGLSRITHHFKHGEAEASSFTKTTVQGFDKTTEVLRKTEGALQSLRKDVTQDFSKERQSIEAMANAREKSATRAKAEEEKLAQAQAKHANKALNDNYKLMEAEKERNRVLSERVALYKQKMLGEGEFKGELDIFSSKNKGKFNEDALTKIRQDVEGLDAQTPNLNNKMKQLNTQFGSLKKTAQEAGGVLQTALLNAGKFLRFYLVGGILVGFVRSIKDGVESIKELDSAMVEVKKVTDEAEQTYEKFTHTAFELGKELGRTGTEVIQATADFARMGFTLSEATGLAEEALLMLNVGDGIENIDQATSSIIATLKGFEVDATRTAEETRRINDVYNEIANNFAVSTGDLAEGVKRTSAVMNQAGNSFDQTVAMFTGGFEVIQDASKVSSGLNIITQRLKAMDMEGNKIEGLAPKLEKAFNDIGLSLYDTNGELKSTFENLQALSEIYPSLTKEQQNYIGELVSGKRQAVVLQAIMSNWKSVEDATVSATEATGSAMAENEKYLDSIEGRAKTLESTMQLFWKNLIDPDAIKTGLSAIISLVEILDVLINNRFSKLILQIGAMTLAWTLTNKGLALFHTMLRSTTTGSVFAATKALISMKIATEGLRAGIKLLSAELWASPLFKVMVVAASITAIVKLIDYMTGSLKRQQDKVDELTSSINSLQSEYDTLSANKNRTEEQEKYLDLLKKELEVKKSIREVEAQELVKEKYLDTVGYDINLDTGAMDVAYSGLDMIKDKMEELTKAKQDLSDAIDSGADIEEIEKFRNKVDTTTALLIADFKTLGADIKDLGNSVPPEIKKVYDALEEVLMLDIEEDKVKDKIDGIEQSIKSLQAQAEEGLAVYAETEDAQADLENQIEDNIQAYEEITSKIQTYYSMLDEINSKEGLSTKSKQDIITKYQELLPYIDNEIELHKQLIKIIAKEEEVQKQAYVNMIMDSENYFNAKLKGNKELVEKLGDYYHEDLENAKSLAEAKALVESRLIQGIARQWAKFYRTSAVAGEGYVQTMGQGGLIDEFGSNMAQNLATEMNNISNLFDDIVAGLGMPDLKSINMSGSGGSRGAGGSKSTSKEYKAIADAYARINLELDRNNVLLQLNRTRQDGAGKDTKKRLELIGQESELMKNRQGLLSQYNDQLREEGKKLQSQLSGIFRFEGKWSDNSIKIMDEDLGKIAGKGEKVDEQFKRIIAIMKELPKASQEWATLNNELKKLKETASQLEKEIISDRVASSKDWIEKRKYYDDWGADNEIAAWERVKAYIEQYYADGKINHKEYTDYILELDKNLERAQKDVWDSIRSNIDAEKRNIYMDFDIRLSVAQAELDELKATMESEVNAIDVKIDGVQLEIEGIQESERLRAENKEREKRLTEISKLQDKYHNLQYGNLGDLSEAQAKLIGLEKEREQYLERQVKLQELQIQLANIQDQKNIRQLKRQSDGTWQFEYVADQKAIEDVNKQVESLQKEHDKTIKDLKEQTLDSLKKAQEDYDEWERNNDIQNSIKERQRRIKRYQDEIKDLQDNYAKKERETNRQFDDERRRLDNFYQDIDLLTDQKLKQLKDTFGDNWTLIAEVVKEHMNDIGLEYENMIDIMSKLEGFESGGRGFGDFVGGSDYSGYGSSSGGSGFKGMSSINPNYGVGAASGQAARDNESRLESDSAYRRSEISRTNQVIRDREMAGMDTSLQRKYLNRLQTGSYAQGGKITETGTFLANFHGKDNDPEWIFNDTQLQKVLKKAVLSTVELALPNIPRIATSANSGGDQIFQISSLEFPNVIDAQGVIDSIRGLPQLTVQKVRTS